MFGSNLHMKTLIYNVKWTESKTYSGTRGAGKGDSSARRPVHQDGGEDWDSAFVLAPQRNVETVTLHQVCWELINSREAQMQIKVMVTNPSHLPTDFQFHPEGRNKQQEEVEGPSREVCVVGKVSQSSRRNHVHVALFSGPPPLWLCWLAPRAVYLSQKVKSGSNGDQRQEIKFLNWRSKNFQNLSLSKGKLQTAYLHFLSL